MKAHHLCAAFFCTLCIAVSNADTSVLAQQKPAAGQNLAVMNFESNTGDAEIGATASELVRSEIMTIEGIPYTLIERGMLNAVLKEQELAMTGAVDERQNAQVGKLLYAEYLVVGKLTKLAGSYRLTAAIVETNTAAVKKQVYDDIGSMGELPVSAKRVALRLFGRPVPETAKSPQKSAGPSSGDGAAVSGSFSAVYSDKSGFHGGGRIVLEHSGEAVTGYSEDPIGRADISATLTGEFINGYYKAPYGYGNFSFRISDGGRILIGTYYQVSNGARGDWIAVKGDAFALPKELYSGRWKKGSRCLVRWSGDDYAYPATVDGIQDGLYHVQYDDGDSEWRLEKYITAETLQKGDVVFGNWKSKGRYYRGKIAERTGDSILINYDDGDTERTTISKVRVRQNKPGR